MTPKEKAEDLIDKMYNTQHCHGNHFPNKRYCDCSEINLFQAKQCALIAVDEMLDFRNSLYINEGSLTHQYLLNVKQEIEKL